MKTHELSFVVQGAIDLTGDPVTKEPTTRSCLKSIRKYHPGAEIILSTWPGQRLEGLDYDLLVVNEDPGAHNSMHPNSGMVRLDNTNRQIVSTRNGLMQAGRKYAVKVRSDMIFAGNDWIRHFGRYPARGVEWNMFRERVITCSMFARDARCPYTSQPLHPPDWIHAGLKEDILLLWNVDLQTEPQSSQWFLDRQPNLPPPPDWDIRRFSPEQYLWRSLLLKFGKVRFEERGQNSAENIWLTEVSFANNLIILDLNQFPASVYKYPFPVTPRYRFCRFITHNEWLRLYHTYSEGKSFTAAVKKFSDPEYYIKQAYRRVYNPLQLYRRITRSPHRYAMHPLQQ